MLFYVRVNMVFRSSSNIVAEQRNRFQSSMQSSVTTECVLMASSRNHSGRKSGASFRPSLPASFQLHYEDTSGDDSKCQDVSSLYRSEAKWDATGGDIVGAATNTVRVVSSAMSNDAVSSIEDSQIDSATRKEARDAFLRGETNNPNPPAPKFDQALRERERSKDSVPYISSLGGHSKNSQSKDVDNYVGFANLPNQVFRKSVKKGFEFTLMVVGESGLGKSTMVNSMFLADLYGSDYPGPTVRSKKTVQVEKTQVVIKENGVQLKLTVVDTPGFGDAVDNSTSWQPIMEYINKQYSEYLNNESRVNRQLMSDTRVHCCLYFISPNGHGLKALDIEFMKQLHDKVNIIPLIAKSDTLTVDECCDFKKTIMNEIERNHIHIYEFPDYDEEEENTMLKKLKERVPFAVVGSNIIIESQGRKVRGRKYPWGVVEVDSLEHNDFLALRNMLIRTNLQDLKDVTNNVHYENFRYSRLASVAIDGSAKSKLSSDKSPMLVMEDEKQEHMLKMKKMEADMEQVFETKVKEKKYKLKESEIDLQKRAEQMKKSLEMQEKEIQERRTAFEVEKQAWEDQQKMFEVDPSSTLRKKKLFNN